MGAFVFPTRLFAPTSIKPSIIGAAQTPGAALSGDQLFAELTGGGRWQVEFGESALWTRQKILAWRRIAAAADGGATPILVPLADRRHQPLANPLSTPDSFGLDTWVDDETDWTPDQVTALVTADAALRATEVTFDYTAPVGLLGGEHFSILHPTWGWRLYRIRRLVSGGLGSGDATVADIRPPLREAIVAADSPATYLNFDSPRCLMRADGEFDLDLGMQKFGKGSARFVELPTPS